MNNKNNKKPKDTFSMPAVCGITPERASELKKRFRECQAKHPTWTGAIAEFRKGLKTEGDTKFGWFEIGVEITRHEVLSDDDLGRALAAKFMMEQMLGGKAKMIMKPGSQKPEQHDPDDEDAPVEYKEENKDEVKKKTGAMYQ